MLDDARPHPADIIDVHAHFFDAPYLDELERGGVPESVTEQGRRVLQRTLEADLQRRLEHMDRAGVACEILSVSNCVPYMSGAQASLQAARAINDRYAAIVREYRGRFAMFAVLPLPHIDESLAELARAFDELGACGVTTTTSVLGRSLGDPMFDPLYEALNRRSAALFCHPAGSACGSEPMRESGLTWALGAPVEDSLCALQLMQAGIPRRFPHMRVILPHLGGVLPFLIDRLDKSAARTMRGEASPKTQVRAIYFDCAGANSSTLDLALGVYGQERIVFGSDFPYYPDEQHDEAVHVIRDARLAPDVQRLLAVTNALSIMPRLADRITDRNFYANSGP